MICSLVLVSALVWHPATNWVDRVDSLADVHARKGGTVRFCGAQPPKSFNYYVDANTYTHMVFSLMYDCLVDTDPVTLEFTPSLARRWAVSEDGREFVFVIDERARWSDGEPITAEDVKWTFDIIMSPQSETGSWKTLLGAFESPEILNARTIRFIKKPGSTRDWRDLLSVGMFYILPKHAFGDKSFNALDLLDAPVSGPYRISRVNEQVETELSRVKTWWRKDFPSCRGVYNFDRILIRYYIDNENAFEALKKRAIDIYPVYTARIMANETHGEKFAKNWILKREIKNHRPIGFQGFAMNMRRKPFDDVRVRKAISMLIDRETMNRTMMSNAYFLLNSYFTDLYDDAHPCPNPFYRFDIEKAKALLKEAGYENGFSFTYLSRSSGEDKFLSLFNHALNACNIQMQIVRKDFAGWMRDMDSYNFDMTWANWSESVFRTLETMWLSTEADRKGSNNVVGFKSEAMDALIAAEKLMETPSERADAYRKADALIASEVPYALLWQTDATRILYWNKFGMPKKILSKFGNEDSVFRYWWYDDDKALELKDAMKNGSYLPQVAYEVKYDD